MPQINMEIVTGISQTSKMAEDIRSIAKTNPDMAEMLRRHLPPSKLGVLSPDDELITPAMKKDVVAQGARIELPISNDL